MLRLHHLRLVPGQDLRAEMVKYATEQKIKAGFIITCVAGLDKVTLRMAGASSVKQDIRSYKGNFEVTSLVGTVEAGNCHLHIGLTDDDGKAFGGHLKDGSSVRITAEIVIGEDTSKAYSRELDELTGFEELVIKDNNNR